MTDLPWDDPNADIIGDVRRYFILCFRRDIERTNSWGWGTMWFKENDTVMDIEEGLRRYA